MKDSPPERVSSVDVHVRCVSVGGRERTWPIPRLATRRAGGRIRGGGMLGGVEQALKRLLVMVVEVDMEEAHKPGLRTSDEPEERHGGQL